MKPRNGSSTIELAGNLLALLIASFGLAGCQQRTPPAQPSSSSTANSTATASALDASSADGLQTGAIRDLAAAALATELRSFGRQPFVDDPPTIIPSDSLLLPVPKGLPIQIGRGFNSLTGQIMAPCVEAPETKIGPLTKGQGGQRVFSDLKAISSLERLQSMWKIDASASFDVGIWKADSRLQYARERASSRFNSFLAITVEVVNKTESLKEYELTLDAQNALRQGRNAFLQKCGDHFIVSRTTGGRFDAIATVNTETIREESSLNFEAGGSYYALQGNLTFTEQFKRDFQSRARQIHILREGGEQPLPVATFAKLEEHAQAFPPSVSVKTGNEWPIEIGTAPLFLVKDVRASDVFNLKPARDFISALGSLKNRALELRDGANFAVNNQYQFVPFDAGALKAGAADLDRLIQKVDAAARSCLSALPSLAPCATQPALKLPDLQLPRRVLQDRVFVGTDAANNGILGLGSAFLNGSAKPQGFTFYESDQRIYVGRIPPCVPNVLFDFTGAYCADPVGTLSNDPGGTLNIPVYRGLIPNINQGRLSIHRSFLLPTVPGKDNMYDATAKGPGMHATVHLQISELAGYMRNLPQ